MFLGNIFVYFKFQGLTEIDEKTRTIVILTLVAVAVCGLVFVIFLPKSLSPDGEVVVEESKGPIEALRGAGRLFITKRMLLLIVTFFYTGNLNTGAFGTNED